MFLLLISLYFIFHFLSSVTSSDDTSINNVNDNLKVPEVHDVLKVCKRSGCFNLHHNHGSNLVKCVDALKTSVAGISNCRYGYPPDINLNEYDYIYDMNSLYPYEYSHYESLALAAPERVQYVHHAIGHNASKVIILTPYSQEKWTRGIVWAMKMVGIAVDEYFYENKKLKKGTVVSLNGVEWPRISRKWIGLQRSCFEVCKRCFRAMTMGAYNVRVSPITNTTSGHCNHFPDLKPSVMNYPYDDVKTIEESPVIETKLQHWGRRIDCQHIAVIVRMDHKRALVLPDYEPFPPKTPESKREVYRVKDFRIIEKFEERFGKSKVRVYFGNTTTAEMLDIFGNACAIVGPPGAGFANVLFAQPFAYVLEINPYYPFYQKSTSELRVNYESNIISGGGTGVSWDMFRIGLDRLLPPFTEETNLTNFLSSKVPSYALQRIAYQSNIYLNDNDYLLLVRTTCEKVKLLSNNIVC